MKRHDREWHGRSLSRDPKLLVVELFYMAADLQWSDPIAAKVLHLAALELESDQRGSSQAPFFAGRCGRVIEGAVIATKH